MGHHAVSSFVRVVIALLAALAAGCGLYDKAERSIKEPIRDPQTTVESVRLAEQTEQGARIEIRVRLDNPNSAPLPLRGSSYQLKINGGSYSFADQPRRTLPGVGNAGGVQVLTLPAVVPVGGSSLAGAAYAVEGRITYEPPGEVRKLLTESKVPLPTVVFSGEGRLE